jgi:hypothetical protein
MNVFSVRGKILSIRREGDGVDGVGMALKHAAARPCRRLLHLHRPVVRG